MHTRCIEYGIVLASSSSTLLCILLPLVGVVRGVYSMHMHTHTNLPLLLSSSIHAIVLLLASMHTITRVYAHAHMNMHTS